LESETLGLVGVVDLVEGGPDGAQIVDYKKGSARRNSEGEREAREPESIQVGAYALLLEEQGVKVSGAVIYYAADKRRVPVAITPELLAKTRQAITDSKALATSGRCPAPLVNDPRCLGCSAYPVCLPGESHWWAAQFRRAEKPGPQLMFTFVQGTTVAPAVADGALAVRTSDVSGEAPETATEGGRPLLTAPEIREAPRPGFSRVGRGRSRREPFTGARANRHALF
jgi:hypothetical protein